MATSPDNGLYASQRATMRRYLEMLLSFVEVQSFRYSPELLAGDLVDGEYVSEASYPMLGELARSFESICLDILS